MQVNNLVSMLRCAGLALAIFCSSDARALDCAKASTPVERAICADADLKAADARLSGLYFSALSRAKMIAEITGKSSVHENLLNSQRAFIHGREQYCLAAGPSGIGRCAADETAARMAELEKLSRDGPDGPDDALALRDYKIDGEIITVASDSELTDQKSMRNKGAELLSGQDFYLRDIWKGANVTAILVETYFGGTDQCRSISVVATRKRGVVTATNLGDGCTYGPPWHVRRTNAGFAFEAAAQPLSEGSVAEWSAASGNVTSHRTEFAPEPGLTMEGLLRLQRPQYRDPLTTAEFYGAVRTLPDSDQTRAIRALWNIGGTCDCNSEDRLNLYGAQIEPDLVAYSGCGWSMSGSLVRCQDTDALAIWDRKTRTAYFAVDDHIVSGAHAKSPKLRLYPTLDQWPPRAVAKFDAWKNGAVWDPSMNGLGHP